MLLCDTVVFPQASLKGREREDDTSKNSLHFVGSKDDAPLSFFGDPTADTSHSTCFYGAPGFNLILELLVDAGGTNADGKPFWKHKLNGAGTKEINTYRNKDGNADAVKRVRQVSGEKARVSVKAKGSNLALDADTFPTGGLIVQHVTSDGSCAEAEFPAGTITVDTETGKIRAKIKPEPVP